MALRWKKRALELLVGLAFTNKKNPSVIPFTPAKTEISSLETKYFHRTTPERRGISSKRIYSMLAELEENPRANIHNILIIKDGEVISEASRPGYDINIRHLSHSMSKTLTGMAVGILISEGKLSLNTRLIDIFPEYRYADKRFEDITVHHLLCMSTGVGFSELASVADDEWSKTFFDSHLSFAPGTYFAYNSMNTYMLAKIVVRITGITLTAFMTERFFKPLGIQNFFLEVGPEGVEKGGWGIYLSAESWAKLGVMMLCGGVFEGKRILPKSWVEKSTTAHMHSPETTGDFNYGYQLWVNRTNDEFLFNGMLGQNVWVCPHNNIVVVVNSENNELFQKSAVIEIIQKHLSGTLKSDNFDTGALSLLREKEKHFFESRALIKTLPEKRGLLYRLGIKSRTPFDTKWNKILGTYTFAQNNHGILPLFIRAMQNNFTGGIDEVSFERAGDTLFLVSTEGGVKYRVEVGLYGFCDNVINFNGEVYIIRARGSAGENEDGHSFFDIEFVLPEMPNSRRLRFSFGEDGKIIMRLWENPNEKIAEPLIEGIYTTNPKLAFIAKMLEFKFGTKFINKKMEAVFSPTLIGASVTSRKYADIVANEKARAEEAKRSTEAISALILKSVDDE